MASFILKDVRIFTGEEDIEKGYVHVEDGKIKSFGSSVPSDSNATVVSKPGHTVLPGFIDAHIHANDGQELALYQSLRFGVTTVMDMHNEIPNVKKLKKLAASGKDMADFKSCGIAATIDNGWPIPVITAHDKSQEVSDERTDLQSVH